MAEIKTVLTAPQVRGFAVCDGGGYQDDKTADWEFTDDGLQKVARAIEAAVLSANAGKVDAERRYEIVRKMNVPQFAELYRRNIAGEGRFDDLVDQLGQQAIDAGKV